MGLDMYLYKKLKGSEGPVCYDEIGYWRKANAIHGYFDKLFGEVENTEYYKVPKEKLVHLLNICKEVYVRRDDPSFAELVLPTMPGFFFGNYEYDDWYYENIKDTIDILTRVLEEIDFDKYDVYYWAWW